MTTYPTKGTTIDYNHLNLPRKVTFEHGGTIEWTYDADGTMLRKQVKQGSSTLEDRFYVGDAEYKDGQLVQVMHPYGRIARENSCDQNQHISGQLATDKTYHGDNIISNASVVPLGTTTFEADESIIMNEEFTVESGKVYEAFIVKPCDEGEWMYEYELKDHIGNSRVLFSDRNNGGSITSDEIIQRTHLYPYGSPMLGDWNNTLKHDFNYKMLGAERHEDFGLNLDLHAFRGRFNDLPNWTSVDALSEDFSHQSPYVVNDNNPIIRVDELGLAAESTQQLLESVWEQGNGSYDNDGNRIEEESGEEEGDCCGEGYGRYIAAKAEAERTEQDISETYKEINRQHYEGSKRSLKEAAIWYFGGIAFKLVFRGGRALWVATRGVDAAKGGKWVYGGFKSSTKWANQLSKRGWTEKQIGEAIAKGKQFNAVNNVNKANAATRYVHPTTGQSVVIDNVTKELLHVGGKGFKY